MTKPYIQPIRLGELEIRNNIWLAPLAGGSNLAYRRLAAELGSGLVTTELVSARGIAYSGSCDSSFRYLEIAEDERPVSIQLFGHEADDFSRAIELILADERLASVDMFDINMGCPVPKVVKTGAGSALMQDPKLAAKIVSASRLALEAAGKPLSVKIRQGFADGENIAASFARQMVDAGAELVTVHARTRSQMYSGRADWSVIREVTDVIGGQVPVIGNGDVTDSHSAKQLFDQTGCDGLMIGRAALGDPWIFARIQTELEGRMWTEPTQEERFRVIWRHYEGLEAQVGEMLACREMRKALIEYVKGEAAAAKLRRLATTVATRADIEAFLDLWHSGV